VINLLLVNYLVWARRLFGARGGKTAYEARLRSASILEEEQAALTEARKAMARPEERADAAFPDLPLTGPAQAHPTPATTSKTPEEDHEKLHA
jgi:hypothetical protein